MSLIETSTYAITTAPSDLPVELSLAKAHCRITHDKEDILILEYISAARDYFESHTQRTLITTTFTEYLPCFPADGSGLQLRFVPVQLPIVSIKYYDDDNAQQTLSSATYRTTTVGNAHTVVYHVDGDWPSTYERQDSVAIEYAAGYGNDASDVPSKAKHCILLLVEHWNRNRSAVEVGGSVTELPYAVRSLLASCDAGYYV